MKSSIYFLIIILLLIPLAAFKIGDILLEKYDLEGAKKVYKISQVVPFFHKELDKRFLAIRVIEEERTTHSEETESVETRMAVLLNKNKNVLGASVTIPVLMYHYIRINPYAEDRVGFNLSVTPANFRAQMEFLSSHGYRTINLDQLADALYNNTSLPKKPIIITLDDGYRDSYKEAFPILKDYKFTAVNFVITGVVGAPLYLTWDQILEMKKSGVFQFGSHTVDHSALTYLDNDSARYEIAESKKNLEEKLSSLINWFAYPYGNVDERIAKIVEHTGYIGAFGTNNGIFQAKDKIFTLPRIRIGGGDSVASFASKLPWN